MPTKKLCARCGGAMGDVGSGGGVQVIEAPSGIGYVKAHVVCPPPPEPPSVGPSAFIPTASLASGPTVELPRKPRRRKPSTSEPPDTH